MKIRPVGAELFHADRQTDVTKLRAAFRSCANGPKKKNQSGIWKIIAVCSVTHTKHINTLCGQNVDVMCVNPGGVHVVTMTL